MEESIFRIFSFCVQLSAFPDPLSDRHVVDKHKTHPTLKVIPKSGGRQEKNI